MEEGTKLVYRKTLTDINEGNPLFARESCICNEGNPLLRGNPKGIHQRGVKTT